MATLERELYMDVVIHGVTVPMTKEEWLDYETDEKYFYETMLEDNEEIVIDLDCGRVYYCERTNSYRAVSWHTGAFITFNNKYDAKEWLLRQ